MIYTKYTKIAINLAYVKHTNQFDKAGVPYIFHPVHIAEQMSDEDSTIVALLHDTLEDTNTSVEEIKVLGFPDKIINALLILTKGKAIGYEKYIKVVAQNSLAVKVKIVDL